MASLQAVQVYKDFFNKARALDNINFDIGDGEFISVLGPSGSGKTTLLRVIAGLDKLDRGKVYIGGEDMTYSQPKDRNISMVFQDFSLFPSLSIRENIAFGLRVKKEKKEVIEKKVGDIAEKLAISDLLDRGVRGLSAGEAQRVALARALITDPSILLLDEPLAKLDKINRDSIRRIIKDLAREKKLTTIYVSHDQKEAFSLADRIMVMHDGRIDQFDTGSNCYFYPANKFVASFIGDTPMNFISLRPEGRDSFYIGDRGPFSYRSILARDLDDKESENPVLAIRVNDIQEGPRSKARKGFITIPARLISIDSWGARTLGTCKLGEDEVLVDLARDDYKIGQTIQLGLRKEAIILFDDETGRRIY